MSYTRTVMADTPPPPREPEWWRPEEAASLGRIEQETIRSFGQVLLAQGYTPEEGRVAIKKYMIQKEQRVREQQQVANTTGETASSTTPEQAALFLFEAQLLSHGHTPEQVRQITAPLAALSDDRSIDVAEAEEAALQSIRAFTTMHVAASEPVENEYQAAQRAKSVVEADAERLCETARSLHAKWKESEAKAKEAQARVVEEEQRQLIQRKRNKKIRRRARKTVDAINAQRDADDRQLVQSAAEPESESDAEPEPEPEPETAAPTGLQTRWNDRAVEQRQRVREEAARAKRAKKERRRARAASEADAAEALRVECEARRKARQRQAAREREDASHEDADCAGDLEFANQMAQALQLSAEEACLREKFNPNDAVAGESNLNPVEDRAPPLEDERSGAECVVCWNDATHIVIPCGHFCLCTNCVPKDLQKCPICRGAMAQVVKVFVS